MHVKPRDWGEIFEYMAYSKTEGKIEEYYASVRSMEK
jgi:hypothetical protein